MKAIVTMMLMFIILAITGTGCSVILDIISYDEGVSLLSKMIAVIVLLGLCGMALVKLANFKAEQSD